MKKQRRKFSKEFKLKVVLEALQERSTLNELGENTNFIPIRYRPGSRIFSVKRSTFSRPRRWIVPPRPIIIPPQSKVLIELLAVVPVLILPTRSF